ncbi:MAG: hypothetical protein V7636_1585, partial [Actinomycetota bacterium]
AAIEALAVGCAVVLCDFPGLGPLVTMERIEQLEAMNFGFESLDHPHTAQGVAARLAEYDAAGAADVSRWVRANRSLSEHATNLERLYLELTAEGAADPVRFPLRERIQVRSASIAYHAWGRAPESTRRVVRRAVPAARRLARQTAASSST